MIKIEITGRNLELDEKMKAYVAEKIGVLEKYIPRSSRGSVLAEVVLEDDVSGREDNRFVCEVILTVEGVRMVSKEGTVNIYAAVDIVEAKIKAQLVKYKEKRADRKTRGGRLLSRWLGRLEP